MDFINWQKIYRNIDSVLWDYYDVIILHNVPSGSRHSLYLKLKDSRHIVISVSAGPYAVKTQYDKNKKVSLFVVRDRNRRESMYKNPGIYLIRTIRILDVRDILEATAEEIEDIKNTIATNMDYFLSYEQLVKDGFLNSVDFEEDNFKREIENLKKREKELLALIEGENKVND